MADFPSKVTTETGGPQQGGNRFQEMADNITATMDLSFIQSVPAILMMVEICLGLVHWALIASTHKAPVMSEYGWVLFVTVTLWILTTILFLVMLTHTPRHLPAVPWPLTVMVYQCVAAVLYLTALLTNVATVERFRTVWPTYEHLVAAAVFGTIVTIAYAACAFFTFMDWKGNGGNATDTATTTTATVPT